MAKSAYLIALFNPELTELVGVDIWSSPEWEQTLCGKDRAFVAWKVDGESYSEASKRMLECLFEYDNRHHNLFRRMVLRHAKEIQEFSDVKDFSVAYQQALERIGIQNYFWYFIFEETKQYAKIGPCSRVDAVRHHQRYYGDRFFQPYSKEEFEEKFDSSEWSLKSDREVISDWYQRIIDSCDFDVPSFISALTSESWSPGTRERWIETVIWVRDNCSNEKQRQETFEEALKEWESTPEIHY